MFHIIWLILYRFYIDCVQNKTQHRFIMKNHITYSGVILQFTIQH